MSPIAGGLHAILITIMIIQCSESSSEFLNHKIDQNTFPYLKLSVSIFHRILDTNFGQNFKINFCEKLACCQLSPH